MTSKYDILSKYFLIKNEKRINGIMFAIRIGYISFIGTILFFYSLSNAPQNIFLIYIGIILLYSFFIVYIKRLRDLDKPVIIRSILFGISILILFILFTLSNFLDRANSTSGFSGYGILFFIPVVQAVYLIIKPIISMIIVLYLLYFTSVALSRGTTGKNRFGEENQFPIGPFG